MLFVLVLERIEWMLVLCVVLRALSLLVSVLSLWVVLCLELQVSKVFVFHKYPPPLPPPLPLLLLLLFHLVFKVFLQ